MLAYEDKIIPLLITLFLNDRCFKIKNRIFLNVKMPAIFELWMVVKETSSHK